MNKSENVTPESVREIFDEVDINHTGVLDFDQFRGLVMRHHLELNDTEIRKLFTAIDDDGSGSLEFKELLRLFFPFADAAKDDKKEKPYKTETNECHRDFTGQYTTLFRKSRHCVLR